MNEPTQTPAVTWRVRLVRRSAAAVGAAVVLSGVGPALANAAGANVANPVAIALRASGRGISDALGAEETDAVTAAPCTPTESAQPTAEPSVLPDTPVETTAAESTPAETATPESGAPESGAPESGAPESGAPESSAAVETTAAVVPDVSAAPSEDVAESAAPSASAAPETAAPETAAPESDETADCATETPEPEVEAPGLETPEPENGEHGKTVSTVAHCAPRGKDPLLGVEGAPAHHGGYVSVAAHGETLTTPWGTFDLSTQSGADELCAAIAAARAALPPSAAKAHGKADKGARPEHGKPAHAGKGAKAHKPARPAKADHAKHGKPTG